MAKQKEVRVARKLSKHEAEINELKEKLISAVLYCFLEAFVHSNYSLSPYPNMLFKAFWGHASQ